MSDHLMTEELHMQSKDHSSNRSPDGRLRSYPADSPRWYYYRITATGMPTDYGRVPLTAAGRANQPYPCPDDWHLGLPDMLCTLYRHAHQHEGSLHMDIWEGGEDETPDMPPAPWAGGYGYGSGIYCMGNWTPNRHPRPFGFGH